MRRSLILLVALSLLAPPAASASAARPLDDVRVFSRVGSPGQPEGILVARDGTVYVSTHNYGKGDSDLPSQVFAYDRDGRLKRSYEIAPASSSHGLLGMAEDARGALYVLDHDPSRLLRLDPRTGRVSVYATFADLRPCTPGQTTPCSQTVSDLPAFADYLVFAPDGTAYVTDIAQGTLWRVPRGGGEAEVWLSDLRLDSYFGPNGIQLLPGDDTLLFAQTIPVAGADGATAPTGKLYTLPIEADGSAGELELFWEGSVGDFPDGFALGRSGKAYVALAGGNGLLVLDADGRELRRITTPARDEQGEVAWDSPASVAFDGTRVLVTNQSYTLENRANWAVLDVEVGERGLPLHRPRL